MLELFVYYEKRGRNEYLFIYLIDLIDLPPGEGLVLAG